MTNDPRDPTKPEGFPIPGDPLPKPEPADPKDPPVGDPEEPAPDPVGEKEHLKRSVGALDHEGEQREDQPLKIIGETSDEAREEADEK